MPRHRLRGPAVVVALALLLGGCWLAPDPPRPTPSTSSTHAPVDEDTPKALARYYRQSVTWTSCGDDFECAEVDVPLDYDDPGGESISIALKRLPATDPDPRLGSLVVDPGGPGSSGTDYLEAVPDRFSDSLRAAYDIVGIDPRGVQDSTAVDCVDDAELDAERAQSYDLATPDGVDSYRSDLETFGARCQQSSGALLPYVDTQSAARDLDIVRGLLGDAKLTYLGYSYGTQLGTTYAELFPDHVGRTVLDGAVDPSLSFQEISSAQAVAFEAALRSYVADCQDGDDCPLSGDVDAGMAEIARFLDLLEASPLPTGTPRDLTQSLAAAGIILALYDNAFWPILTEGLDAAMVRGDGSALLFLADLGASRESDGTYSSNLQEAYWAVTCLDYPVTDSVESMAEGARTIEESAPVLGKFFTYAELPCTEWPIHAVGSPKAVHLTELPPILVVGTTHDPATPYPWAQSLSEQLEGSRLLTFDGQGHTAYGRSNACIKDAVDAYLLEGTLPEEGLVC